MLNADILRIVRSHDIKPVSDIRRACGEPTLYDSDLGLTSGFGAVFVQYAGGTPIGYVSVLSDTSLDNADSTDISVYVHPDFQMNGSGKRLVQFIEDWLMTDTNVSMAIAGGGAKNMASRKLFMKQGYKITKDNSRCWCSPKMLNSWQDVD